MKPTQKQVIAWAREAGYGDALSMLHSKELERFADLVAAAEREACADICDHEMDSAMNLGMKVAAGNCADKIRGRE